MKRLFSYFLILFLTASSVVFAQEKQPNTKKKLVYEFDIKEEIGTAIWRKMQKALAEAKSKNADIFLIHMNTYGGALVAADSMRTAILEYPKPTFVFIDNNAASAGALISLACDSIYMRKGANIGAATVVNGTDGKAMPDKYQSYMRSMMRATAQAKGGDTTIQNGKEIIKWRRNSAIAEAMVDDRLVVPNVIDSGKTLTFTTNEALLHGYCEAKAESVQDVLAKANIKNYELHTYKPSIVQEIISLLFNPFLQSILIMVIIGGIWFELQSPGIGFPLLAAIIAATLYFLPLILEGFAANWEIGLFFLGIILLLLEFLVIPGFGVAGVLGLLFMFVGLVLSMVDILDFEYNPQQAYDALVQATFQVTAAFFILLLLAFAFGGIFFKSKMFRRIALNKEMSNSEGYIGIKSSLREYLGQEGIVFSDLRPSGSIKIGNAYFDAVAISGFIPKGKAVRVTKFSVGQLYVEEI